MFPFSVKYSVNLDSIYSIDRNKEIFEYIENYISKRTGEDIVFDNNRLTFKSKFFRFRWNTNILGPIEKGIFIISEKGNKNVLTYEFYMYRLFIIASIMSIFIVSVSQNFRVGILCFLWLGGMNWLIAIIRQKMMMRNISKEINKLISQ